MTPIETLKNIIGAFFGTVVIFGVIGLVVGFLYGIFQLLDWATLNYGFRGLLSVLAGVLFLVVWGSLCGVKK